MLGSIISSVNYKIVWLGLELINKVPYSFLMRLVMITCSLSLFLDMCLSPHVVQKRLYGKTSVGEAHRDHGTKFNQKNIT
jgi:hypothetical protein